MSPGLQEILALGVVALVVAAVIWRRWRRRGAALKAGACGDCAAAGPPAKEAPVRFYRRDPDKQPGQ